MAAVQDDLERAADNKKADTNVEKRPGKTRETTETSTGKPGFLSKLKFWQSWGGQTSLRDRMPKVKRPEWVGKPNPKAFAQKLLAKLPKPKELWQKAIAKVPTPKIFEWRRTASVVELGLGIIMITQIYLVEAVTPDWHLMFAALMGLMLAEKGKSYEPALIAGIAALGQWQYGQVLYIEQIDYAFSNFGLVLYVVATFVTIGIQGLQLSRKS